MTEADEVSISRHREYQRLCKELGLPGQMVEKVWCGCEPAAQENMLDQLRASLAHQDRYVQAHGDVW